jgi:hypothetical protein
MSEDFLPICVDEYPGDRGFDPEELPDPVDLRAASRHELALAKYKLWQVGQELRIRFLDGTPALHERVKALANTWLDYANLRFTFGNFADAEIRITFQGNGYRSLIGTDTLLRSEPQPTMILGGFTQDADEELLRRVVLHEFGHALGCVHEQANPTIDIPWDTDKVYAYYWTFHGWNQEMVDRNVLMRYQKSEVHYTQHDPKSIMQYPVNNEHTLGDFEIGWNTTLSDTDKIFIGRMYPYPATQST